MTHTRDPLSERYDRQANVVLNLVIEQREKHDANRRLAEGVRVRVTNPPARQGGTLQITRAEDAGGLTADERAFQRALYYDRIGGHRIHVLGRYGWRASSGPWSLRVDWEPAPLLPGRPRFARVTVFSDTSAARHAKKNLADGSKFTENPDLRSGWGTDQQRFG